MLKSNQNVYHKKPPNNFSKFLGNTENYNKIVKNNLYRMANRFWYNLQISHALANNILNKINDTNKYILRIYSKRSSENV